MKDQAAIETLGGVLAGSNRPLFVSSGVLGLAQRRPGTEEDVPSSAFLRQSEATGLAFASKGVRVSVTRLSPTVHGDGDHGFVPQLISGARAKGFAAYIGAGKNRWPAVHRLDAARLYRLALEKGTAGGRYHGVAEEGVAIRDIVEIIGKRLRVPAVSKSAEEVVGALSFIRHVLAMDAPSSSKLTQESSDGARPSPASSPISRGVRTSTQNEPGSSVEQHYPLFWNPALAALTTPALVVASDKASPPSD